MKTLMMTVVLVSLLMIPGCKPKKTNKATVKVSNLNLIDTAEAGDIRVWLLTEAEFEAEFEAGFGNLGDPPTSRNATENLESQLVAAESKAKFRNLHKGVYVLIAANEARLLRLANAGEDIDAARDLSAWKFVVRRHRRIYFTVVNGEDDAPPVIEREGEGEGEGEDEGEIEFETEPEVIG